MIQLSFLRTGWFFYGIDLFLLLFGIYMLIMYGFPGGGWHPLWGHVGKRSWISAHPIFGRAAGVCLILAAVTRYSETLERFYVVLLFISLILVVTGIIVELANRH